MMTFVLYRDLKRQWRWRLVARNGRILADSAEGYNRRQDCLRIIDKIAIGTFHITEA
jgi:hypothetical protein